MAEAAHGNELVIPGIDGVTPLGFLAALGLLQVLRDNWSGKGEAHPTLSWKQPDSWRPVLHEVASLDHLVKVVATDAKAWATSPLLAFKYVKLEKKGPRPVGGLKAPVAVVRAWQKARRDAQEEYDLSYAGALFCDGVAEPLKRPANEEQHQEFRIGVDPDAPIDYAVERTFFDYTVRNAQFLEQVQAIREYLSPELIRTALETGTVDYEAPRTLDWDPSADTPGAIYTGYRRGFLPVHEWLAFRALRLFPLTAAGSSVRMTACTGRRLDGTLIWPLWERPATLDAVASIIGYPRLDRLRPEQRRAFGISALLCAGLTKKADGYTGTFAPTRPA